MSRLRVCLVSAAYRPYPSGVSEHVHHLAESLRDLGQDVSILTGNYQTSCPEPDGISVARYGRVVLIPMNRSYATVPVGMRLSHQVRMHLDAGRFDIVHCHGISWPEISYWALRHSHATNVVTFVSAGFRIHTAGSRLYRSLFRRHLKRIHGRIAISRRAREAAEPYVPGEFRIIPCGIDLNRFRPGTVPKFGGADHRPTILFLGRLDARKGIETIVRAMPLILESVPAARLLVVGRGPMEQPARRLVSQLRIEPSVTFAGAVAGDELPGCYTNCDVYCSPALGGETLGIVLLEAMASGRPVVASRIPGYDETVRDGIDGLLVPPSDAAALARDLVRVLSDANLRERLTASGIERARGYAWPVVARRTLDFYEELASERGRAQA